jgi:hypothetical protein
MRSVQRRPSIGWATVCNANKKSPSLRLSETPLDLLITIRLVCRFPGVSDTILLIAIRLVCRFRGVSDTILLVTIRLVCGFPEVSDTILLIINQLVYRFLGVSDTILLIVIRLVCEFPEVSDTSLFIIIRLVCRSLGASPTKYAEDAAREPEKEAKKGAHEGCRSKAMLTYAFGAAWRRVEIGEQNVQLTIESEFINGHACSTTAAALSIRASISRPARALGLSGVPGITNCHRSMEEVID